MYGIHPDDARERLLSCGFEPEQLAANELWVHQQVHAPAARIELE
jgi:hypothetical protein